MCDTGVCVIQVFVGYRYFCKIQVFVGYVCLGRVIQVFVCVVL